MTQPPPSTATKNVTKGTWKERAVTKLKVLSRYLYAETEKTHENVSDDSQSVATSRYEPGIFGSRSTETSGIVVNVIHWLHSGSGGTTASAVIGAFRSLSCHRALISALNIASLSCNQSLCRN
jgi:hypothetical protein